MSITNKIEGIFRLLSPLHCASVGDTGSEKNVMLTQKQSLITRTGKRTFPIFPSNDMRGRLRRKAAALVLDHIVIAGKVKVDLYAGLMAGAITASPESDLTVEEALRARDNVYMGLFGGGTRLLRSRFSTNDLVPVLADTIEARIVPAHFCEDWLPTGFIGDGVVGPLTGFGITDKRTSFRIDDVARVTNINEMEQYIENVLVSVAKKQEETLSGRKVRKDSKTAAKAGDIKTADIAGKKDIANMFAVESIMRGTPMYCLIDLQNDALDAHVGLLLLALQALVREQALGGWIRIGFGRYSAELVLTRNGQRYQVFALGQDAANATLSAEVHTAFCVPAIAAMGTLTAESMMAFFTPRVAAKDVGVSA